MIRRIWNEYVKEEIWEMKAVGNEEKRKLGTSNAWIVTKERRR